MPEISNRTRRLAPGGPRALVALALITGAA